MLKRRFPSVSSLGRCLTAVAFLGLALNLASFAAEAPATPKPATPAHTDATVAAPKEGNAKFFQMHESFLQRGKGGPMGVLFLGDSITEGWTKAPDVWKEFYEKYQPANFGIG